MRLVGPSEPLEPTPSPKFFLGTKWPGPGKIQFVLSPWQLPGNQKKWNSEGELKILWLNRTPITRLSTKDFLRDSEPPAGLDSSPSTMDVGGRVQASAFSGGSMAFVGVP